MTCDTLCRALAVIDHVVSTTACVVPVKSAVHVLRQVGAGGWRAGVVMVMVMVMVIVMVTLMMPQHGVENIMVDGAHAPGSMPLHIPSLGADYYVGNLHKCACSLPPSPSLSCIMPLPRVCARVMAV